MDVVTMRARGFRLPVARVGDSGTGDSVRCAGKRRELRLVDSGVGAMVGVAAARALVSLVGVSGGGAVHVPAVCFPDCALVCRVSGSVSRPLFLTFFLPLASESSSSSSSRAFLLHCVGGTTLCPRFSTFPCPPSFTLPLLVFVWPLPFVVPPFPLPLDCPPAGVGVSSRSCLGGACAGSSESSTWSRILVTSFSSLLSESLSWVPLAFGPF